MTTKHLILLWLLIAEAAYYVARIGRQRKPITAGEAVFGLGEFALIGWLALS